MKVLWITNIIMPDLAKALGRPSPVFGGWLYSLASTIEKENDISLGIATIYNGNTILHKYINGIDYYLIPSKYHNKRYEVSIENHWKQVIKDFKPSLVHLHGTEYYHTLSFVRSFPKLKIAVSIQGLVSECANYYMAGISYIDYLKSYAIKDILLNPQKRMTKRGKAEIEIIQNVKHIIGRTNWDYCHIKAINPNAIYHFCNETLRPVFYTKKWSYTNCIPHSIFLSQASYPLKGAHQVIKALNYVLDKYPDTQLYIAGQDLIHPKSLKERVKMSSYGRYLKKLISLYNLDDKIHFLGILDEIKMCEAYERYNVFICPSSIENSPNSLCEAQLMGMPCIASYAGGIPDIMKGREEWLYRFEDYQILAELICKSFEIKVPFDNSTAIKRHDAYNNYKTIISIYDSIIKKD